MRQTYIILLVFNTYFLIRQSLIMSKGPCWRLESLCVPQQQPLLITLHCVCVCVCVCNSYPTTNLHLEHLYKTLFSNPSSLLTTVTFFSGINPSNKVYPSSDKSTLSRGGERSGGEDGRGSIIAASRDPEVVLRRGREERVCVLARRREVQMQW